MPRNNKWITALIAAATLVTLNSYAQIRSDESSWPTKPIKAIVPLAPGGAADMMARLIGPLLARSLGQSVIVENRTGAAGIIGTDAVAKSSPDGYTLLLTVSSPITSHPYTYNKLPYNPMTDLMPVALVGWGSLALVVSGTLPVNTLKEFIALAQSKPDTLSYGSSGQASAPHLLGAMFARQAGVRLIHVPYKGQALATQDLVGGQLSAAFSDIGSSKPFIQSGRLKALAVSAPKRLESLPDVPTFTEHGFPTMDGLRSWTGVFVRAGTPAPIVSRLSTEITRIVRLPEVSSRLIEIGSVPLGAAHEEAANIVRADWARWGKAVHELGDIRAE